MGSGIFGIIAWRRREKYLFKLNRMAAIKDKMVENTIETYRILYMLLRSIIRCIFEIQALLLSPEIVLSDDVKNAYITHVTSGIEKHDKIERILDEYGAYISTNILIGTALANANISLLLNNVD